VGIRFQSNPDNKIKISKIKKILKNTEIDKILLMRAILLFVSLWARISNIQHQFCILDIFFYYFAFIFLSHRVFLWEKR